MKHSIKALLLTTDSEGYRSKAYRDQGGKWTYGWGATRRLDGKPVEEGDTCNEYEAHLMLDRDFSDADNAVNQYIDVKLNQNQFDALADFTFNDGPGALKDSTLRKLVNKGLTLAASAEFMKWIHVRENGVEVVSDGLKKRREAERKLFLEAM